jgi:uncharacterized protein involved in exopolysaccharide biosynthesis
MVDNISARDLIGKIILWRKKFLWITVVTLIISGIIVFLIPKQYKSVAILFPARQFSVSKLVVEANAGNQEDYMMFGDADDTEKLLQLLTSDELKLRVADAFDLWQHWKIRDTLFRMHYLKQKWEDMVTIKRTEFNSVRVEVHDYTANGAAIIANGIVDYCDSVRYQMNREVTGKVLKIVKDEYDATLGRMKELEDSLDVLRHLGVLHYREQVEAYSRAHAKALEKNDVAALRRVEGKLDTLKRFGGAFQNIKDNLERYAAKYPDIKMKYDEALVNHNTQIPFKFVVERARPNEWKSRPKRMVIIGLTVLAANLMGLFFLLMRERFGKTT